MPLFRARLIGLGFDPERELVLLELREHAEDDDEKRADADDRRRPDEESEGYVARIYATRAQVRAMAARGRRPSRAAGRRARCASMPMDPAGHRCPRWN